MNIFDDADIISAYPLDQAIKYGVLVEIFKNRWGELSGGKPIVATAHLSNAISLAGLMEIWNAFVHWRKHVMPKLPEADRLFHTTMNSKTQSGLLRTAQRLRSCIPTIIKVTADCSSHMAWWAGAGTVKKPKRRRGENYEISQ